MAILTLNPKIPDWWWLDWTLVLVVRMTVSWSRIRVTPPYLLPNLRLESMYAQTNQSCNLKEEKPKCQFVIRSEIWTPLSQDSHLIYSVFLEQLQLVFKKQSMIYGISFFISSDFRFLFLIKSQIAIPFHFSSSQCSVGCENDASLWLWATRKRIMMITTMMMMMEYSCWSQQCSQQWSQQWWWKKSSFGRYLKHSSTWVLKVLSSVSC